MHVLPTLHSWRKRQQESALSCYLPYFPNFSERFVFEEVMRFTSAPNSSVTQQSIVNIGLFLAGLSLIL